MNENKKRIDIHRDFELHQLMSTISSLLFIAMNHIQQRTPYGDAYKKAYYQFNVLYNEFNQLEDTFADCVNEQSYYKIER